MRGIGLIGLWVLSAAWAQVGTASVDRLTDLDRVRLAGPSTRLEWLFNMGLVSGVNEFGEKRHFAVVFNSLIGPSLSSFGWLPYPDFENKPVVLLTLHDLDHGEVLHTQVQSDYLDSETFDVYTRDLKVFQQRRNSQSGVLTRLHARTEAFAYAMQIRSTKPQALFGDQGWADNGSLGKALYLSRTGRALDARVPAWVELRGERVLLTQGQFWEDHQLVDPLHFDLTRLKWNWFALHFADRSEAMIYKIEDRKTGLVFARFAQRVRPDGSIEPLEGTEVTEVDHLEARGFRVPRAWEIRVPGKAWIRLDHVIPAPWYDVSLGLAHDSALEGKAEVRGRTSWGAVTLAWAEYTSSEFFWLGWNRGGQ